MAEISSSVALLFRLTAAVTVTDTPQRFQTRITSAALSHNFILSGGVSVFIRLINDLVQQYDVAWLFCHVCQLSQKFKVSAIF